MSHSTADVGFAFGLTLGAGLCTSIGAAIAFCIPPTYTDVLPIALAFSAGVMIYVSFMEIMQKGVDAFETELSKIYDDDKAIYLSHIYTSLSFFIGIIIGYIIDYIVHCLGYDHDIDLQDLEDIDKPNPSASAAQLLPNDDNDDNDDEHSNSNLQQAAIQLVPSAQSISANNVNINGNDNTMAETDNTSGTNGRHVERIASLEELEEENEKERKSLIKMSLITALAIGIHNFPEGLATFVSALADPTLGVSIAVAIAIHNIPEGVSVAMPIYFATGSKCKAFFWAFLSGIFEPIGALIGYLIIDSMFNDAVFGVLFGFVAGIMIYISFKELLPTARTKDKDDKYTSILVFVGFLVMDISLILFKLA